MTEEDASIAVRLLRIDQGCSLYYGCLVSYAAERMDVNVNVDTPYRYRYHVMVVGEGKVCKLVTIVSEACNVTLP